MYYGLVYFPKTETENINKIRQKYDPTYYIIEPHLTIMFPVPSSIGKRRIIKHIGNVLRNKRPIALQFGGYRKSWDHWLLLTVQKGNSKIKKLSGEIYSGILSKYRREDIKFIPHIGLGLFVKNFKQYELQNPKKLKFDKEKYREALSEAESKISKFKCTIDILDLVKLNNNLTAIETIKKFELKQEDI